LGFEGDGGRDEVADEADAEPQCGEGAANETAAFAAPGSRALMFDTTVRSEAWLWRESRLR